MAERLIGVAGAGAWGTALAGLAAANGNRVILWTRSSEHAERLARTRSHDRLPDVVLAPTIEPTAEPQALAEIEAIVLALPAQELDAATQRLAPHLPSGVAAIIAAKGIEIATGRLIHEVVGDALPTALPAILSGPSFAIDVARGLPTAVTLAAGTLERANRLATLFAGPTFRPYASDDLIGTALGGAVKNVLAIAAGIADGRNLGASAAAALVARGYAELARLIEAMGGRRATAAGLSGLGDLVLTCSGPQSRNFALGKALGQGATLSQALADATGVVEGVATAQAVARLAAARGVEMPISELVAAVLDGGLAIDDAVNALLARPLRSESDRDL